MDELEWWLKELERAKDIGTSEEIEEAEKTIRELTKGEKIMPNCPACGEGIDSLKVSSHKIDFYTFRLIGKAQEKDYEEQQGEPVTEGGDEFYCPECNERIFTSEKDAEAFLKGGERVR